MFRAFAIEKAGAVIHVDVSPGAPRQREIDAGRERLALVMIEEEDTFFRRFEISQAAGNGARAFGILMGIGGMKLRASSEARRVNRAFPSPNRARSMVSGKKILELPRMSWSKKLLAPVRKLETSKVHPATGWSTRIRAVHRARREAAGNRILVAQLAPAADRTRSAAAAAGSSVRKSAEDPVEARHADGGTNARIDGFSLTVEPKCVSRTPPLSVSQLVSLYWSSRNSASTFPHTLSRWLSGGLLPSLVTTPKSWLSRAPKT